MDIGKFLTEHGVAFETLQHPPAYTAQEMAAEEHVSGNLVAKTVVVKGDGKYALCASSYHLEPCLGSRKETIPPVKVVDLDDASVVCETDLPVHWINADRRVLWLDDSEAIIADYPSWQRFNYRTGARLKPVDPGKDFGLGRCLSDDGKTFFSISGGLLCGSVELLRFSLESGQTVTVGKTWPPRFTGNAMGLVPGGRYFYVADPGMYIFDRDSLRLVAQKRLNGKDLLSIAFNRSGSRCAVAIGARKFVSERGIFDPGIDVVLCVYETLSGKTLFALPLHERYVRNIAFSRADDRLAVVTDSGAVELWKLPPASP